MNPVISNNFALTALKQGEDAFVCDLTNQMDAVPVDANGKVTSKTDVSTTARIIKGAGIIPSGITPTPAASMVIAGVTPTVNISDGEVTYTWSFAKGTTVSDARYVKKITLTYNGHSYSADFTLVTDKSGATYNLLPSLSEIPFVRDDSNVLTPSSMYVYCGYVKNQDGTVTTVNGKGDNQHTNIDSRYYIYYRIKNADGTYGSYTQMTKSGIQVKNSDTYAAIEFVMSSATTVGGIADANIIDIEDVPVIRQNERGYGIVCSVQRNNFTEAQWNTDPGYGVIGHSDTFTDTSSIRNGARKGDLFTVVGTATDTRNGHTATYRCTNASGNLSGVCIAHQISKAGDNTATVQLFRRSATAPDKPTAELTYTFSTGALTGSGTNPLAGWSQNIPSTDGHPCWVIQATAVGTGTTDKIAASEWSEQRKLVEDGTSPYVADLDNEMDSVACDADGKTTSEQYIETNVCFYKGNTKQTIKSSGGIVCKIGSYELGSDYAAEGSPTPAATYKAVVTGLGTTNANVKIYIKSGTSITSTNITITVKSTIDGADRTADLVLTMNGIRPGGKGENAILYNLMPSVSEINIGRTDAGGYSPTTFDLTCGYKKNNGGTITSVENATSRIDSKYYIYYRRRTRSNQTWEGTYFRYDYYRSDSSHSLTALDVTTYDAVEFIICTASSTSFYVSNIGNYTLVDKETVPVISDGKKGDGGPTGNGISSDEFYYCQTTTVEPPQTTYLTETYGWYLRGSANCPTAPTGKNNYLWECRYIQYDKDTSMNKKILRLVMMRDTDIKPNLLEQTAFDSEDSMDQWMYSLGSISNKGEVIPQARGGMNAFGAFPTSASEKDFLQQLVFEPGTLAKIQSNEWYTLSFYARARRYINRTNHTYGFYFQDIYLKAGTYKLQFNGHCSSAARAASQPVQLNGYLFNADWSKQVQASITSKIDTTITTGTLTVTTADTYKIGFYAYKSAMVGGDAGENVTVNWWRIISVSDNSQIYTFLYPSAVKNGSTYFVDGVVKSSLAADCNVCWQLDEDADDCDNLGWTRHSVTFRTKSSITEAIQKVLFRMYKTYVEICMIKLEQNAMATEWCENEHDVSTECSHNPCGTWAPGVTYYYCNGQRDVVRALEGLGGGMTWFRMKKRTSSAGYTSNTFPYLDTEHWEKGNKLKFTIVDTMFAEEIFTDKLTVTKLKTTGDDSYIDMHDGEIDFFGRLGFPNIVLGVDSNGCAVLKFYDKDGNFKYDLGPDGIMDNMDSLASSMASVGELGAYDMTQSWSYARERALPNVSTSPYYRFAEGWTKTGNVKKYHVSGTSTPSSYNNKVYNSKNMTTGTSGYPTGTKIASGYYLGKELMRPMVQEIGDTVGLYSRRVYSVASEGAVPVLLGELCYLKGEHVNDTRLADLEGNPLSCSTSHNMLYYIQNANQPTLQA